VKKNFVLIILIISLMCPITVASDKDNQINDASSIFNQTLELSPTVFYKIYQKFGTQFRLAATLEACGQKNMAKKILPSDEMIQSEIFSVIFELRNDMKHKESQYIYALGVTTQASVGAYRNGYEEATNIFLKNFPSTDLCSTISKRADKYLEK
jgi:hypothetical protein